MRDQRAAVIVPDREPCLCGRDHSEAKRCPHGIRHWFIEGVGERLPNCTRCGAPNPRWTQRDQEDHDARHEPEPSDPRVWLRCYEVNDDADHNGRATCSVHTDRRYNRDIDRAGRTDAPHHLYLGLPT